LLFGITFATRPGREAEVEALCRGDAFLRHAADAMGAIFDALFVKGNTFTLLYDFPGIDPEEAGRDAFDLMDAEDLDASLARERVLALFEDERVRAALRKLAPLLGDPFDADDATSFAAWVQRHKVRVLAEERRAHPAPKRSSASHAMGFVPR
jgi:hypothetical protein